MGSCLAPWYLSTVQYSAVQCNARVESVHALQSFVAWTSPCDNKGNIVTAPNERKPFQLGSLKLPYTIRQKKACERGKQAP